MRYRIVRKELDYDVKEVDIPDGSINIDVLRTLVPSEKGARSATIVRYLEPIKRG